MNAHNYNHQKGSYYTLNIIEVEGFHEREGIIVRVVTVNNTLIFKEGMEPTPAISSIPKSPY